METSSLTTVISAFVLGAGLAAGLAVAFLSKGKGSASTSSTATSEAAAKKKKKKAKTNPQQPTTTDPVKQSDSQPIKSQQQEPLIQSPSSSTSKEQQQQQKKKKAKKVKDVQVGNDDISFAAALQSQTQTQINQVNPKDEKPKSTEDPFPSLNLNSNQHQQPQSSQKKKKDKGSTSTSWASVAVADPPKQVEPVPITPARKHASPSTQPQSIQQDDLIKPKLIVVPATQRIDLSSDSDDDSESAVHATRVLKFQEKEELDDGWTRVSDGASTKKAPTLRLVGSSSSSSNSTSYPVKPAAPPASQLTKTQLNNQRKAEKLKAEKEAVRILQEQRRQEFKREAAAALAKEKAVQEAMKRGAILEKQRLAALKAPTPSNSNTWKEDEAGDTKMLSTFWSRLILLAICRHTTAIYCTNDRPVLVSGTSGIITDGSPAFQHSRAGSDCAWIITPTSTSNFTIEFSHWELNPSSDIDRIEVILVTLPLHTDGLDATRRTLTSGLAEASERVIGKVSGYIEKPLYLNRAYLDVGVGSVKTYSVLSTPDLLLQQRRRFVVPDLDPATQRIKVRFVTDPFGPQFDGFFARWWSDGYDKSSTCPFDCFEGYGRGLCSLDGVCVCGEGYSGVACHNDDKKQLMSFYSTCHGESWINSSGWNVSHPCHDVAYNEINLSAIIDWNGVGVCVANRVTSLQLPKNNIVCPSNANVQLPYFTRVLDLSENFIQTFPAAISGLAQLSVLSLGASNISGVLPYDFFTAPFPLLNLNLSSNNLGGGFYGGGWVNGLLRLDLSGNQFEGWIPVDIYMMAVPGSVWVDGNNFLCPSDAKSNGTSGALNPWTCLDDGGSFVQPTHVVMPTSLSPARIYIGGLNYVPKKIPISCVLDNGIVVAGTPSTQPQYCVHSQLQLQESITSD
ncbi:hypothetical protein BCR33DRAFT_788455 [Rhizoclosmatium globosum]|uniref:EGF-like domain-containing protein n=1 Tax=Rhizoclosmatium globosum TaxID=329046 RepID=A0A1Y2BWG5_9FUNG|nr:hypothetical protein BCR33DRAFT_788455 [Rhizoclosmatium globosum]|eukprot:ORY39004.1 hypothetical protein BCR33DRAFT_788455 [Rhizoclosmatium globosum]